VKERPDPFIAEDGKPARNSAFSRREETQKIYGPAANEGKRKGEARKVLRSEGGRGMTAVEDGGEKRRHARERQDQKKVVRAARKIRPIARLRTEQGRSLSFQGSAVEAKREIFKSTAPTQGTKGGSREL